MSAESAELCSNAVRPRHTDEGENLLLAAIQKAADGRGLLLRVGLNGLAAALGEIQRQVWRHLEGAERVESLGFLVPGPVTTRLPEEQSR